MPLVEATILDPSTALGLVAGWSLAVFPAGAGLPSWETMVQLGALVWLALQLVLGVAGGGPVPIGSPARLCGVAVTVSAVWVGAVLALAAYLAALALPRLSPVALMVVPALLAGVVMVHVVLLVAIPLLRTVSALSRVIGLHPEKRRDRC
jgi:hypothetical protein